jgi:diguanylate cyclase (GGDEF)-like protein
MLGYADLDGFKRVNDRFGHEVGDAVLRHVAELIKANVRPDDYVARLGGDEFAILLVRALPVDGVRRLGSIEQAIAESPARLGLRAIRLSASIGAAPYTSDADPSAVIDASDRAMYFRKRRHHASLPDGLRLAVSNQTA